MVVLARLWDSALFWRRAAGVLTVLSAALLVAAIIARDPPDFSSSLTIAVIRDNGQSPVWKIRLAGAAHQIAADTLRVEPFPTGRAYQLWLLAPGSAIPHQLGLLPQSGRRLIPVSPQIARQLTGAGELLVSLEPSGGAARSMPGGNIVFRGTLEGSH